MANVNKYFAWNKPTEDCLKTQPVDRSVLRKIRYGGSDCWMAALRQECAYPAFSRSRCSRPRSS